MPTKPPTVPGGMLNMVRFARDPLGHLQWIQRDYGAVAVMPVLNNRVYCFGSAEAVHEVLVTQAARFDKWGLQKQLLKRFGDYNLPNMDGEDWRRHRKMMQPAFHTKRIQAYADDMVQQTLAVIADWQTGQTRNISDDMKRITLLIVSRAIFGMNVSEAEMLAVGQAMETVQKTIVQRGSSPIPVPDWWPSPDNRRFIEAFQIIRDAVQTIVQQKQTSGEDSGDLLSQMILMTEADEKPLSPHELMDEALALFIAGHETTASTLMWACCELARNPGAAAAFYREIETALGGKTPGVDDLSRLPYTEAVIKETLRLYPPLYFMARTPNQSVTLEGCEIAAKNSTVILNIYAIHHNPQYYDDPARFLPERWLADGDGTTLDKKLPRGAYVPFGDGPRICLGSHFALLEMRLALATIAQRFRLELPPDASVTIQAGGTLIPRNGLHMKVAQAAPA